MLPQTLNPKAGRAECLSSVLTAPGGQPGLLLKGVDEGLYLRGTRREETRQRMRLMVNPALP